MTFHLGCGPPNSSKIAVQLQFAVDALSLARECSDACWWCRCLVFDKALSLLMWFPSWCNPQKLLLLCLALRCWAQTVSIHRAYRFIAQAVYYDPWRILVLFCFRTKFGQDKILKLGVPCSFSCLAWVLVGTWGSSLPSLAITSQIGRIRTDGRPDVKCDLLEEDWKRSVKSLWGNYREYKVVSGKLE